LAAIHWAALHVGIAEFVQSLPPVTRRVVVTAWGAVFIVAIFGLVPAWVADVNDELDWPRWRTSAGQTLGVLLFLGGLGLAVYCSRLFARIGKGTPVPIAPPTELVVSGLYRFTRNPIYVAQVAILSSYFCYSGELALLLYSGVWALLVQGFVVWIEEPDLRRRFGDSYLEYTREVPRWVGIPARRRS
jgi:protein-S-isoprenylcysteine O-methyltransferase Ste14